MVEPDLLPRDLRLPLGRPTTVAIGSPPFQPSGRHADVTSERDPAAGRWPRVGKPESPESCSAQKPRIFGRLHSPSRRRAVRDFFGDVGRVVRAGVQRRLATKRAVRPCAQGSRSVTGIGHTQPRRHQAACTRATRKAGVGARASRSSEACLRPRCGRFAMCPLHLSN